MSCGSLIHHVHVPCPLGEGTSSRSATVSGDQQWCGRLWPVPAGGHGAARVSPRLSLPVPLPPSCSSSSSSSSSSTYIHVQESVILQPADSGSDSPSGEGSLQGADSAWEGDECQTTRSAAPQVQRRGPGQQTGAHTCIHVYFFGLMLLHSHFLSFFCLERNNFTRRG